MLNLVKNEGASAVVVEGDMSYSANPTAWWNALEGVLGTSFPVFISRGNHDDSSWTSYLPKAANHLGGATRVAGAHDANYKTTYRGLVIATVKNIQAELPRLQHAVPAGATLAVVHDSTTTIRASIRDVHITLILSIALVILVVGIGAVALLALSI